MAKHIQGELPLFGETFLPGDEVRLVAYIPQGDWDDTSDGAADYIGRPGHVINVHPQWNHPIEVQFADGAIFLYTADELEQINK